MFVKIEKAIVVRSLFGSWGESGLRQVEATAPPCTALHRHCHMPCYQ